MKKEERIRRALLLCCHYTRNLASYRAGWKGGDFQGRSQLVKTLNSNFIDIAVMEWCKLFGNYKIEKHHWKKIVKNKTEFKREMLIYAGLNNQSFHALWKEVLDYRDKFVAHLDSDEIMHIPLMEKTLSTIIFYYNELRLSVESQETLYGLPTDLIKYYDACYENALKLNEI